MNPSTQDYQVAIKRGTDMSPLTQNYRVAIDVEARKRRRFAEAEAQHRKQLKQRADELTSYEKRLKFIRDEAEAIERLIEDEAPPPESELRGRLVKGLVYCFIFALFFTGAWRLISWALEVVMYNLPSLERHIFAVVFALVPTVGVHFYVTRFFGVGDDGRPRFPKPFFPILLLIILISMVAWAKLRSDYQVAMVQNDAAQLIGERAQNAAQAAQQLERTVALGHIFWAIAIEGVAMVAGSFGFSLLFFNWPKLSVYRCYRKLRQQSSSCKYYLIRGRTSPMEFSSK
jgi:hypothetical protein